jgi:hypothetical protein
MATNKLVKKSCALILNSAYYLSGKEGSRTKGDLKRSKYNQNTTESQGISGDTRDAALVVGQFLSQTRISSAFQFSE